MIFKLLFSLKMSLVTLSLGAAAVGAFLWGVNKLAQTVAFPGAKMIGVSYNKNEQHLQFVTSLNFKIPVKYYRLGDNLPTIIFCHGNGADIGNYNVEKMARQFNSNFCIFEYSGYGLHTRKQPSESNIKEDAIAIYNWLVYEQRVEQNSIIIMGHSLGTWVSCSLANHLCLKKKNPNKVILIAAMLSGYRIITDSSFASSDFSMSSFSFNMPGNILDNGKLAHDITCPVYMIHGERDEVIPHRSGKSLSAIFPNCHFQSYPYMDHNNVFTHESIAYINNVIHS